MTQSIQDWLNEMPPESEIEWKESIDDKENKVSVAYQPIWVIEDLLNKYCKMEDDKESWAPSYNSEWCRLRHRYSFIEIGAFLWLATSHELALPGRTILCASCIKLADYEGNSNILATGIAEATKAGVKVLGNRFGASLNDRKTLRQASNGASVRQKMKPDNSIRSSYEAAKANDNKKIIKVLEETYDFNATETKD